MADAPLLITHTVQRSEDFRTELATFADNSINHIRRGHFETG